MSHTLDGIIRREGEPESIFRLRVWWAFHEQTLMAVLVIILAFVAFVWLGYEIWRFVLTPEQIGGWRIHPGANDLKLRYFEVQNWFTGHTAYGYPRAAVYPPASHVILWPFVGWLKLSSAKILWLFTMALGTGWLVFQVVRESRADTVLERSFIALIPVSMYATGATIGNGQLILHILPALLAGLFLLCREKEEWGSDLLAAALLIFTLVKPTVSAPFFWMVIFIPGRLRPILLVLGGYLAVSLFAASFRDAGFLELFIEWVQGGVGASANAAVQLSHGNLHSWFAVFGLQGWNALASIILLFVLGVWTYFCRKADKWLLISAAGLIARLWTYHGWYDDLLILPSIIALFRIIKHDFDLIALLLFGTTLILMMAPGGQYLLPAPYNALFMNIQSFVWVILLLFFARRAWGERSVH